MPDDDANANSVMVPLPVRGRVFSASRRVRLGDASPAGRLRFDALARYLQDVSNDDTRDARQQDALAWVVRRTVIDILTPAVIDEVVTLQTFCGGIGSRWAERRVSLVGDRGASIEVATLWVHLDPVSQRPKVLPPQFRELYGEAAAGRVVRARLHHDDPPPTESAAEWFVRFADFDVLGHVNNAAYWEAVEEQLAARPECRAPMRAELEFRSPVEKGAAVTLITTDRDDGFDTWLVGPTGTFASALVRCPT